MRSNSAEFGETSVAPISRHDRAMRISNTRLRRTSRSTSPEVSDNPAGLVSRPLALRRAVVHARLPLDQRSMKAQQRGRLEDDRGADQPARAHEGGTQAGDHAIRGTEIGRPFSRTIEDQQLVLDKHGFGHHGTGAAGPGEPGDGCQQMQKQDGQITHRPILAR
jgi:hypothetical protein